MDTTTKTLATTKNSTSRFLTKPATNHSLRIGLVVPHIFMHEVLLPHVIFSPAQLALGLADGLIEKGHEVTLYSPGPVATKARNVTADLTLFESELQLRSDTYLDLLKKHPFTFITLARQVQGEIVARAYADANAGKLDIVHVYTNEEELALPFAQLCERPVIFTHHDPFNFLVKYKNFFPKYASANWISLSYAQRKGMPSETNWVANIYHGLQDNAYAFQEHPTSDYIAYLGRIIEPKGVHLAIAAVREHNRTSAKQLTLKIAGKHYGDHRKDAYWQERIAPTIGEEIDYIGFTSGNAKKDFLANARALIVPSIFEEPFGLVAIEALASGTPVIALNSGALPEIISNGQTGWVVSKTIDREGNLDEQATAQALAHALAQIYDIQRKTCREDFLNRFTIDRMCQEHVQAYQKLALSRV